METFRDVPFAKRGSPINLDGGWLGGLILGIVIGLLIGAYGIKSTIEARPLLNVCVRGCLDIFASDLKLDSLISLPAAPVSAPPVAPPPAPVTPLITHLGPSVPIRPMSEVPPIGGAFGEPAGGTDR
jgi:hypothetical protein